jgi:hypothetical protein
LLGQYHLILSPSFFSFSLPNRIRLLQSLHTVMDA